MSLAPSPSRDDYYTALRAFLLTILPDGIEVVQKQDNRVPQPTGFDFVTLNEVGRRRLSTNVTTYADCTFSGLVQGSTLTVMQIRLGRVEIGARLLGGGVQDGTAVQAQLSGRPGANGVYALSAVQQSPISGASLSTGAALIAQPTEITIQVDVYGPGSSDNTTTITTLLRPEYASLWFARQGWTARGIDVLDIGEPRQMPFIDGEAQYEDRWSFDVKLQANQVTSPSQDFADAVSVNTNSPADGPSQ